MNRAANNIEEVDQLAIIQTFGDPEPFFDINLPRHGFISCKTQSDDKIRPDPISNGLQDLHRKPHSIFEVTIIGRIKRVGQRRSVLIEQMPIGFQLDAIHATSLRSFGSIGVFCGDARNIPIFHFFGKYSVCWLVQMCR
jgi:hypothetical protein